MEKGKGENIESGMNRREMRGVNVRLVRNGGRN